MIFIAVERTWSRSYTDPLIHVAFVVGSPMAPEGPLEVNDISRSSCSLSWKPPKDDGGKPIKGARFIQYSTGY